MFSLPPVTARLLLITDELSSPADFILHKYLHSHLKEAQANCILLSVSEDVARWKAVAAKSNLNLNTYLDSGSLRFVNVLSHVVPPEPTSPQTLTALRPLYDIVAKSLSSNASKDTLVIIDDISSLEWMGFSTIDLARFIRALNALCLNNAASLVIRHHLLSSAPDDLFRLLLQLCVYHVDVRALASGKSGAVSGEIAIHLGVTTFDSNPKVRVNGRSAAIQYRLTDTGAIFFERGIGAGVL